MLNNELPQPCDEPLNKALGVVLNCSIEAEAQSVIFERKAIGALLSLAKANGCSESTKTRVLLLLRRACKFLAERKRLNRDVIAKGGVEAVLGSIAPKAAPSATPMMKEHVSAIMARCARDSEGRVDITNFEASAGVSGVGLVVRCVQGNATNQAIANMSTAISELSVDSSLLPALGIAVPALVGALRKEGSGIEIKVMHKNAAVALAKLAKHPTNLMRLRQLHGIELMYRAIAAGGIQI